MLRAMCGALVAVWICAAGDAQAGDGLVAHWNFDEGKGDVLHDRSGKGNDGKIHGAKFVKVGEGHALRFDGEDDYVDCGAGAGLDLREAIAVEAWVRPDALPRAGREPGVAGKGTGPYGMTYFGTGKLYWYLRPVVYNCSVYARPGVWHHVVGTFDGMVSRLYLNGKLAASRRCDAKKRLSRGKNFYIGGGFGYGYGKGETPSFGGMIDEVRVYSRALSEEEIVERCGKMRAGFGYDLHLKALVSYFTGEVVAVIDRGVGAHSGKAMVDLEVVAKGGGKALRRTRVRAEPEREMMEASLAVEGLAAGEYEVRAVLRDGWGNQLAGATTHFT